MLRGRDRDEVHRGVDAVLEARGENRGEACGPVDPAPVQPDVVGPPRPHLPHDRFRHHVARRELLQGMDPDHEALPPVVEEDRALTSHRLRDQRLLPGDRGPEVHHRRVELHELHVGDDRACPQTQSDPITGRDAGIRGGGEDLSDPAGRQHHRRRQDRTHTVDLPLADHVQRHALGRPRLVLKQVEDQCVLDDLDPLSHLGDQGTQDLRPGGVTAGVGDPVGEMSALPGQGDVPIGCPVEFGPPPDQAPYRLRTGLHEYPDGRGIAQAGPGHQGVLHVLLGGVLGAQRRRDPPLRPSRGTFIDMGLRHDDDLASGARGTDRGGEPGDPGTHNDHIGLDEPSGRGGVEGVRQDHRAVTSTAQLSIRRVEPSRAAMSNRPRPMRAGPSSGSRTSM